MRSGQLTLSIFFTCSLFLLLLPELTHAEIEWLHVSEINISGNRHTKEFVVLREMQIKKGDNLKPADLNKELELARQHIYNTLLFVKVMAESVSLDSNNIRINIILQERWYIYPIPDINLVDRSFNEWWVTHHADINRLNYGINFIHNNLRGRSDPLKIYLNSGYTRTIAFSYSHPYSNHRLTRGFTTGGGYTKVRETSYLTGDDNKMKFFKKDNFVNDSWNARIGFIIRNGLRKRETITLEYNWNKVDDSIIILNPRYFNQPVNQKGSVQFAYQLQYYDVDNIAYPLSGDIYGFSIIKQGFRARGGVNYFSLSGEYKRFFAAEKKWYFSMQFLAQCKLPFDQPYVSLRALGFENYVRGLEYFVIDGVASLLSIFDVKKELIQFTVPTFIKGPAYHRIPFRIYAKAYTDIGYTYLKYNRGQLNNRILWGKGFGLDIVTLHELHLRVEYSFNQLGQNGLFLHNQSGL